MLIKSLEYSEYNGNPKSWKVSGLESGNINLVVGKNASGKSRVMRAIHGLGRIISGKIPPKFATGTWKVIFSRQKGKITEEQIYILELQNGTVQKEAFQIDGKLIMSRDETGNGFVIRKSNQERVRYKVPVDQLMTVVRRDEIQHPFFEHIHRWGSSACFYEFGSDFGKSNLTMPTPTTENATLNMSDLADNAANVFHATFERFGEQYKKILLSDLDELGYACDDVLTTPINVAGGIAGGLTPHALAIKETNLNVPTLQHEMSQGMYRALAILIQFNANILWTQSLMVGRQPNPGDSPMIIIDDIGEGLDYSRSKNLISVLVRKSEENHVQLILTSNDRFIMNDVPLPYWTVLHRTAGTIKAFNFENSKNAFEEFSFMGLSNFDFFSGQYFLPEEK